MHLRSLLAGVGLVATANALLLPPVFNEADEVVTTLPVPIEVDADLAIAKVPESQTVNLECPGCLQFGRKHRKEIPSHLQLEFRIESLRDTDRLTLNGYELYPKADPLRNTLTAPVLPNLVNRRKGGGPPHLRGGPNRPYKNQPLGFAMETGAVATDDDEDLQLINVEVQIIEVGNVFIEGIPNVQVKLVKTPTGKLAIGTIDTISFQSRPTDGGGKEKECSTTLCKWKAIFFQKLYRIFKGCDKSQGGRPPHAHEHGEHRHGHGPHAHHMGQRHGWGHGLRIIVTHVLFPILIGIVAGISASIIGMMFGTLIVLLWRTFFRRSGSKSSHRCRYAHKASKDESAIPEEKSGLLNEQEDVEAPPAYMEATPAITDKKSENEA